MHVVKSVPNVYSSQLYNGSNINSCGSHRRFTSDRIALQGRQILFAALTANRLVDHDQ